MGGEPNWVYLRSAPNGAQYFYDANSVSKSKGVATFWARTKYPSDMQTPRGVVDESLTRMSYKC